MCSSLKPVDIFSIALKEFSILPEPNKPARSADISAALLKLRKLRYSVLVLAFSIGG